MTSGACHCDLGSLFIDGFVLGRARFLVCRPLLCSLEACSIARSPVFALFQAARVASRRHYHSKCTHTHNGGEKKGMVFHHHQLEKVRTTSVQAEGAWCASHPCRTKPVSRRRKMTPHAHWRSGEDGAAVRLHS